MNIEGAITYIKNWRQEQNLEALAPQDERESAIKLIQEKGYKLPDFIPDGQGNLQLKEGVYMMKDSIEIVRADTVEPITEINPPALPYPLYPPSRGNPTISVNSGANVIIHSCD